MTPMTPACTLSRTDSWPSVAPTSCVLSMRSGIGRAPERNCSARVLASSSVN